MSTAINECYDHKYNVWVSGQQIICDWLQNSYELAIVDPVGRKALVTQFNNGRERELAGHGNLSAAFCKALP